MQTGKTLRVMGAAAVVALFAGAAGTANAGISQVNFQSGDSIENTGVTFGGTMSYDDTANLLTVNLSNTSSFQSVITGFYFNIAGNASASYNAINDLSTAGVDESAFGFATSLPPFGSFEGGAVLLNLSQQQVRGIDEGETGNFTFDISGTDAGTLTALDFLTQTNSGGGVTGAFAVRFQSVGINAEDSDKVIGVITDNPPPPNPVPLPPAAWAALATMGMTGLGTLRRRFRRSA